METAYAFRGPSTIHFGQNTADMTGQEVKSDQGVVSDRQGFA